MTDIEAHAAKRWLFAYLSPYAANPPLPESLAQWGEILRAADNGLVLPRLGLASRAAGDQTPVEVTEHLELSLQLNRLRNLEMRKQLITLIQNFNSEGVVPVIIKGAVTLLDGGSEIASRVMLDMDVWTPDPADFQIAVSCLQKLGYEQRSSEEEYRELHHGPPFFLEGALSRIELHHQLVHSSLANSVSEQQVIASLRNIRCSDGQYRLLSEEAAMKLSYLQARTISEEGYIIAMKWLDFVDRCKDAGLTRISSAKEIGVSEFNSVADRRFLTAVGQLFELPYTGPRDDFFLQRWQQAHKQSLAKLFLQIVIGNAKDPSRWRNRRVSDYWRALSCRIKELRASYWKARSRDYF